MKAIDILNWICKESINGEDLNTIDVPKEGEYEWEQNEDWWLSMFGSYPPSPIEAGKYLYYYRSSMNRHDYITDEFGNMTEPNAEIEIPSVQGGDFEYIYLYKIDD